MTFAASPAGAADPYAPHVVTFANGSCAAGRHSYTMADLSVVADELPSIVARVRNAGDGPAQPLVHNGVYQMSLAFTSPPDSGYRGPTSITVENLDRTDMLWLGGIAASIAGSFGVAAGGVLQKRAHTRNDAAPAASRSRKCCGGCLCNLEWFVGFSELTSIPAAACGLLRAHVFDRLLL
jgi:hypothetical protein